MKKIILLILVILFVPILTNSQVLRSDVIDIVSVSPQDKIFGSAINNYINVPPIPDSLIFRKFNDYNGKEVEVIVIPGIPPSSVSRAPISSFTAGSVGLSNFPAFDWSFGCTATSAAMIAGYYDNNGYPNMYNGPTNSGTMPLTNQIWGSVVINGETRKQCPLSATRNGLDGRSIRGHVDDYWIQYGNGGPDPYITNGWTQHTYGECTGDYMKTSQSAFGNNDGWTRFYYYTDGSPYTGTIEDDMCYGFGLFLESRGYDVINRYNQIIQGYNGNTLGFTFSQFVTEINAGRPVIIHVTGHTMVGFGYELTGNTVYIRDTWDYSTHTMTWGGSYSGMDHIAVSVFQLATTTTLTAPVASAASNITTTSFSSNWNASTGASGYYLDVSTSSTFASFVSGYNNKLIGNVVTSPVTGLTAGTTYYYRVRAYNTGGSSEPSNAILATTMYTNLPPTNLTGETVKAIGFQGGLFHYLIRLNWSAPLSETPPTSYNVFISNTDDGTFTSYSTTETTYILDELPPMGSNWRVKATAVYETGESVPTEILTINADVPILALDGATINSTLNGSYMTWNFWYMDYNWYRFYAPPILSGDNKYYEILANGGLDLTMQLYKGDKSALVDQDANPFPYFDTKLNVSNSVGEWYYIKLTASSPGNYNIGVKSLVGIPYKNIIVDAPPYNAEYLLSSNTIEYRFKTGIAGIYTIQTNGALNTVLSLYDANGLIEQDDEDGEGSNALIQRSLAANTTYFVRFSASSNGHYSIGVIAPTMELVVGDPCYSSSVVYRNETDWYKFQTGEAGIYIIEQIVSSELFMSLYESDQTTSIAYSYDQIIEHSLKAHSWYYIRLNDVTWRAPNVVNSSYCLGVKALLTLSSTNVSLGYESGSSGSFNITSNTSWSIIEGDIPEWLNVSPTSGGNDATITVTANSANIDIIPRTAVLKFTGNVDSNTTITITQDYFTKQGGNTEVYPSVSASANRRAVPITFSECALIKSITIYHNGGTGNVLLGVYSDQTGTPSLKLGDTALTGVNLVAGWQTIPLQNTVSVTAGQKVWLSWVFEKSVGVRYTAGTPGRAQSTATWTAGMPAVFGAANILNNKFSVYCTYTNCIDPIKPIVASFAIPSIWHSLTAPVNSFTATDNIAVTGYKLTETDVSPNQGDAGWTSTAPTSYTFASEGIKVLYAWAKDAAGNVSELFPGASVTIILPAFSEYLFEESSGDAVIDSKGSNNGIIMNNAARVNGVRGSGLKFTGTEYINLGSCFGENVQDELTLSAWIKPTTGTGWKGVIMHGGPNVDSYALYLEPASKTVGFKTSGTTDANAFYTIPNVDFLWDGNWHFVAVTYNGTEKIIYIDNTVLARVDATGKIVSGQGYNLRIGAGRDTEPPTLFYDGLLDEVRIQNYALTNAQVGDLYKLVRPNPDIIAPVISLFTILSTSSLTVPISITANDEIGVWGYMLTENNVQPSRTDAGWTMKAPTTYTFSTAVTNNLWAWAKDAAGNIGSKQVVIIPDCSDKNLGNIEKYPLSSASANRRAVPVIFSESGLIKSITIYHNGGTGNILGGVYSDLTGTPSSKLGNTAPTGVNSVEGWQTILLNPAVSVTAGQKVWLSWVFEKSVSVRYTAGTPGRAQSTATWTAGMPAAFGAATILNNKFSIYCTYTTCIAPTLSVSPTSISLDYNSGTSSTFKITSNTSWSITDDASWLDVSPLSGTNNGTITVIANSANTGTSPRTATVTIVGTGVSNKTVTVTQAYGTLTATLGNTEVYSSINAMANRRAIPVSFTEAGSIQSLSIYHNGGTGNVLFGVYSDASGLPSSQLGVTAATIVNTAAGWQTVSLLSPVNVTVGQKVWLSWVFQNSVSVRYSAGTPGRAQSTETWTAGMPGTFGAATILNNKFSIYCTYIVDGTKSAGIATVVSKVSTDEFTFKAFPNPFTDKLNIEFSNPSDTHAKLEIYNIAGSRLETLFNGPVNGGELYTVNYLPKLVSSQIVLYHLTMNGKTKVGKMIYNERR